MAGSQAIDLRGNRFGRLIVVSRVGSTKSGHSTWLTKCDYGGESIVSRGCLVKGETQSCGCLNREAVTISNNERKKHNGTKEGRKTSEYNCWSQAKQRCENPLANGWKYYGGRGITMCQEWRDSFVAFFDYMGKKPAASYSIDRIDVDGNYEPGNCRWATPKEQANNKQAHKRRCSQITVKETESE